MRYRTSVAKRLAQQLLWAINELIPKSARVLVIGYPNSESSAVATANYLGIHYSIPVTYAVSCDLKDDPRAILVPKVRVIYKNGSFRNQMRYFMAIFRSRYLFLTHGIFLTRFPKRQVVTNIWHGILYKKIGLLIGARPMPADITVGTSPLTVKMFAAAFGVPEEKVYITGYPRNDLMLKAKWKKTKCREKAGAQYKYYEQLLIWLPTFRKNTVKQDWEDGTETGNPFYILDFDVAAFNDILAAHNSYCFVKPHPMAVKYPEQRAFSHLAFIDDAWISARGLSLYELLGVTDLLISDVSSVVIDYLLMEQPILCVSTDFESYAQNRGFYFEDIENWLPGPVLKSQDAFFKALTQVLKEKDDGQGARRLKLKDAFFEQQDARSTERLINQVFKSRQKP